MLQFLVAVLEAFRVFVRCREVLALRQQVAVLKRQRARPGLRSGDRLFWIALRRFWSRWADTLLLVKPETVIGWHRAGFRLYWRWRSRPPGGRPRITQELRDLIVRLAKENPDWGAPKIHAEWQKLGLNLTERTVARYLRRTVRRGGPAQKGSAFLQNHREVITALDFFSVPTVTFRVLYCLFVMEHGRRKILHCNVTPHPTAEWMVQQLREAFAEPRPYRYVILDRDRKCDGEVLEFLHATGLEVKRTSVCALGKMDWRSGGLEVAVEKLWAT